MLEFSKYRESTVHIDNDQGEFIAVVIHVARLTKDQHARLQADLILTDEPPSLRLLGGRKPEGDEQAKDAKDQYTIADPVIYQRRYAELKATDPEKCAEFERLRKQDEAFAQRVFAQVITDYVSLPEGQIAVDGVPVLTGAQLLDLVSGRQEIQRDLVTAVWTENTLGPGAKKAWRLLSSLAPLLRERQLVGRGTAPAEAVQPVDARASVHTEAAMASTAAPSTPSRAATSSGSVQSATSHRKRTGSSPSSTPARA